MNDSTLRVWVEEIAPPTTLRFTWNVPLDSTLSEGEARERVTAVVEATDGVKDAADSDDGLVVEIDPGRVSRYDLARIIREALQPETDAAVQQDATIRVWAEDLSASEMRITWRLPESSERGEDRHQRRRVAAWLTVVAGVRSASPDDEGVVLRYLPDELDRTVLGEEVRLAVHDEAPLRERSDELLKRAPTYGNLARKLALDDRISPLPGAAKQAVAARATGGGASNAALRTAVRFVPGAALISRIQTLVPMLTELSTWSREADPEIVDQHLASVNLDRETLRRDTITAHEIRYFARDSAAETASALGEKAAAGARQAITAGRDLFASMREAYDTASAPAADPAREDVAEAATKKSESSPPEGLLPKDPQ